MESEYRNLIDKVLKQVGRNILLFQQIEKGLKIILPFISHPTAPQKDIDDIRKQREFVKAKTLGLLVNSLVKSTDSNVDYYAKNLKNIVNKRNQLVHHFGDKQGLNILTTEEGCKTCLICLNEQYQEAIYFYKEIEVLVFILLDLLQKTHGESHLEIQRLHSEFKKSVMFEFEYINLSDPCETVWENTRIVNLLQLAEINIATRNNMTPLAKAGEFIKKIDPECTPKRYGIKNLKGVLKASGLFEVREMQNSQQSIILYKSKKL
ncbi:OST-HTH/LOTUS domain-containing protein [Nostoc sp. UHCC 0870]|uniref:OST-HTH/LOTUS domain-containing protein n=1 Tax=Nostoc sp. UHCC 0870 TaxID=2914041 RepID=UPI001EDEDB65|nr:OST-HTH/LOTUS domain-containing protein [Nostoc sp. UHCC 0870]UKO97655.1 OST-HTH/LOTUS domain-containing protein [Nostoc sp. UHCC 0870]